MAFTSSAPGDQRPSAVLSSSPPCVGPVLESFVLVGWITADPLAGPPPASPIVTKTSIPTISTLGYAQYFCVTGTNASSAPVAFYIVYCSYDGGPYQFVFVDAPSVE